MIIIITPADSDVRECEDWIEAINLIAAFYSPPFHCLPVTSHNWKAFYSPPVFREDVSANTYRRCFSRSVTPVCTTPLNLVRLYHGKQLRVTIGGGATHRGLTPNMAYKTRFLNSSSCPSLWIG